MDCDRCGEPIDDFDGVVAFTNGNAELGPVGSHPRESDDIPYVGFRRRAPAAGERVEYVSMMDRVHALGAENARSRNVRIHVLHDRCNPEGREAEPQGYWIDVDRIRDFAAFAGWTQHLADKVWFGRQEMLLFLRAFAKAVGVEARPQV